MAFDPARLFVQLQNTGLQNKDSQLYQLIRELIRTLSSLSTSVFGSPSGSVPASGANVNATYLTTGLEPTLPNSRQHLAGKNISFDDSIFGARTVNGNDWGVLVDGDPLTGTEPVYSVLTNGNPINPEVIFDSFGDIVMTETRRSAPGIIYAGTDVVMTSTP